MRNLTSETENRAIAALALLPSFAILLVLVALPTFSVALYSLQDVQMGEAAHPFVGFENFLWAWNYAPFWNALNNTLVWVFGSVSLEMVIGVAVALMLNRNFVGRGIARAVVFAPYLIPTVVAVLVWRYMFHDVLGVVNYFLLKAGLIETPVNWLSSPRVAMTTVIIVGVWKFFPFVVLAILGVLQAIPQDQYEAAKIDGASEWQQFWRITLPHLMPIFLLTALLRSIWTFHKFDIIYLLTGGGPVGSTTTLPVLVYQKAFADFEIGRAAALALITAFVLTLLLLLYFYLSKQVEARQ
ncbi:MAG: sugar ABC transporter permease [Telmatospirillum sp.]|nr:sugar ABC transporter permease [Telmatospirillum sp.]